MESKSCDQYTLSKNSVTSDYWVQPLHHHKAKSKWRALKKKKKKGSFLLTKNIAKIWFVRGCAWHREKQAKWKRKGLKIQSLTNCNSKCKETAERRHRSSSCVSFSVSFFVSFFLLLLPFFFLLNDKSHRQCWLEIKISSGCSHSQTSTLKGC